MTPIPPSRKAEPMSLITWKDSEYSGASGTAGGIGLFSISWHTLRDRPKWKMATNLPGLTSKLWESDDRDDLKATAETALAGWLARVTAKAEEA